LQKEQQKRDGPNTGKAILGGQLSTEWLCTALFRSEPKLPREVSSERMKKNVLIFAVYSPIMSGVRIRLSCSICIQPQPDSSSYNNVVVRLGTDS
jgi:hypothetical protein